MKRILLTILLGMSAVIAAQAQSGSAATPEPREFEMKDGDTSYVMRRYVLVLLYKGKKAEKVPKSQRDSIQAGHMANIKRLADAGKLIVAGPMGDDGDLRGIFILDCETVEEAEALVAIDPAIQSGRLRAELHPWWTAKGTVIR